MEAVTHLEAALREAWDIVAARPVDDEERWEIGQERREIALEVLTEYLETVKEC